MGCGPGDKTVIGPSTGNFGIGTAYISRLKGYRAIVVMPDNMSEERYERIRKYEGDLDLTPGTESDVILTLERTHQEYVGQAGTSTSCWRSLNCCPTIASIAM